MFSENEVKKALQAYIEPFLERDLISTNVVRQIAIHNNNIDIDILLGYPFASDEQKTRIQNHLQNVFPAANVAVNLSWKIEPRAIQSGLQSISSIKNIIAIASGKGGVGKSTTTVNLALALAAEGAKVGILDADIYGPNQPQMLGASTKPNITEHKKIEPIVRYGIQSMSIGYLVEKNAPVIWRGPMVTGALLQLLNDTQWETLDYLFIDLPPGTGDIQLTLAQKIPVSGAVIVTTPQEVALLDARKGIEMFNKVKIPVMGIVENMSWYVCAHCGEKELIFGAGGGEKIAQEYSVCLLGQVPLMKTIREQTDKGKPTVAANPASEEALLYRTIAKKVAAQLSLQAKDYTARFPKIIIEKD